MSLAKLHDELLAQSGDPRSIEDPEVTVEGLEIVLTQERVWSSNSSPPRYLTPDDMEDDVAYERARNAQDKAGDTTLAFGQDGEPLAIVRRSTWQSWSQSGQVTRVHGSDKR
jgi:hypothetical protein